MTDKQQKSAGGNPSFQNLVDAEEALHKSEAYLQSIFRVTPTGIGVVVNRVLKQVNKRLCAMTGYAEEELIGKKARMLYPDDDAYQYVGREKYRQIKERGTGTVETRWKLKDGRIIDVLLSSTPLDPDDLSKGVTFTALDITERKQAEEKLRESETRFRALFDNAAEGILVADLETRQFIYANPKICHMFGYSEEELTRLSVNDIHPPESLEHTIHEFEAQARGEKVLASDIACLRKDGSVIYTDINTAKVDLDGRGHNIGMFSDISARRHAEIERQRMQKLESLGTIAGGIAHDFNNLLMGIFGNIELAKMDLPADHKSATYLAHAHSALEKARRLTGQLLTFAKGGDPVLETVDTDELVKETVAFNLSGSSVLPRFDLQKGLWPVKADKGQIGQVLANLIINAKQAMPDGGRLCITGTNMNDAPESIPDDPGTKYVRLSISDEGTGIPSKIIDRIFDPYFTTKQSSSGLGLAIVHSIMTKHGGHISVDSTPDIGTTVTLLLPADLCGTAGLNREAVQETGASGLNSWYILFMDDNEAVRSLGSAMLSKFGHVVDCAVDGEEALEKYIAALKNETPYDLVILDLTVPGGMGGKEAMDALLAVDPRARAIVSSGYSSDPVIAHYGQYGFSGCLIKPFALAALKQELSRVMAEA